MSDKLRAPIKDLLDASLDEVRVQRMWRGMQGRPERRPMPPRWVVAGAAVVLVLAVFSSLRAPDAGPLVARGASTLTFDRPSTVLSDGSQIELGSDARLELLENSGQSFAVRLERGRAHFDVTPGGPRRWRMECGLASVTVIGTALTLERGASSLRVEVAHGIVEVRGNQVPGGLKRLTAGQSLSLESQPEGSAALSGTTRHAQPAAATATQPAAASTFPPTPPVEPQTAKLSQSPPTAAASSATAPPTARASATSKAKKQHDEPSTAALPHAAAASTQHDQRSTGRAASPASAASQHSQPSAASDPALGRATTLGAAAQTDAPSFPAPARAAVTATAATQHPERAAAPTTTTTANGGGGLQRDAAGWLAEADRARQLGDQGRALAILQRLLREQPDTSVGGIAAFTLARMQMEQEPLAAVDALRASLAAATPATLREDALARLVEAYARSGNLSLARSTAAEYRRKYPSGRLIAEVERWAATP